MDFLLSLFVFLEIVLFLTALSGYFSSKGIEFPDSFVYSVPIVIAVYSVLIQGFFILGIWRYFWVIDIIVVGASIYGTIKYWSELKRIYESILKVSGDYKLYFVFFAVLLTYLFIQAFLVPNYNSDAMSYNLARVLMFQNEGSLFLENYTTLRQVIFPWGYDILHFLFLRFYSDFGLASFGFICYTTIILGTYSIVRNVFADKKYALFTAFIVGSFSQLILQATNVKNDIPLATLTVAMILAFLNFSKDKKVEGVLVIIISAIFGLSIKSYFPAFALPFVIAFFFFVIYYDGKEGGFLRVLKFLKNYKFQLSLIVGIVASLVVYYYYNYSTFGGLTGPEEYLKNNVNTDGITGGVVNFGRYVIQLFNLPNEFFGKQISDFFNARLFGDLKNINANQPFGIPPILSARAIPSEEHTFYGVIGNLLIFPALIYSLIKGDGRIRIIAISLLILFIGLCFAIKWDSARARFMIAFFAGSGVCFALLLRKIYLKRGFLLKAVTIIAAVNMSFVLFFNAHKPAPFVNDIDKLVIKTFDIDVKYEKEGSWISWIFDRDYNFEYYFGDGVFEKYEESVGEESNILLLSGNCGKIFPFMRRKPEANFFVRHFSNLSVERDENSIKLDEEYLEKNDIDYVVALLKFKVENVSLKEIFSTEGINQSLTVYRKSE